MIVWLLPLLVALVAIGCQLAVYPGPDVAWLLYASREVLHGAKVGTTILENTPPMIFAVKLPFVWLAERVGVSAWGVWVCAIAAGVLGVIAIVRRLLPEFGGPSRATSLMASVLAASLLLIPGGDFGQREHVTAMLVVPYVALSANRLRTGSTATGLTVLVGALAGIGIGIKPHFVIVMAGLVLLEVARLGWRSALAAEHLAIVAVGLVYLVLVVGLAPGYIEYARTYGPLYQHFLRLPVWLLPVAGEGLLPGLVGLGCWVALRRFLTREALGLVDALAMATSTFYLVAVLQGKGWRYHFLPSIIFGALLTAVVVWRSWHRQGWALGRIYLVVGAGMLGTLAAGAAWEPYERFRHPSGLRHDVDPNIPNLLPLVKAMGPRPVAVFSSNIASSYPLLLVAKARSAFRYPSLWPLVALYADSLRPGRVVLTRPVERRGALERTFTGTVLTDVRSSSPGLLLVMRADSTEPGWGAARRFDYLKYFGQDPEFAAELAQNYTPLGRSGSYDVFARRDDPRLAQRLTGILLRTNPPSPPPSEGRLFKLLTAAGFLVAATAAWRASGPGARAIDA